MGEARAARELIGELLAWEGRSPLAPPLAPLCFLEGRLEPDEGEETLFWELA